jgi:pseudaminic acid synthase
MKISNHIISENSPVFIIAELSANHNGSLNQAINTIRAAKRAGANCVKLQTYTASTITLDSDKDDFVIKGTLWEGKKLFDLYSEAYTPWEWHETLFKVAEEEGLTIFSSPFDKTAVDFLESLNVPAYKIASFEITDIPLIEYVASKQKPIIISTGIAGLDDIELAIRTCHEVGNYDIALLKCTSSYPAPIEDANLTMIQEYAKRFNVVSGLSDHTIGSTVPIVATTLGAKIIEKHFITDRSIGGADSSFSMNEVEFSEMVRAIRDAENSLGRCSFELSNNQIESRNFSRSLYVVKNLKSGDTLTEENVKSIRPGYGLHPKYYNQVVGKKVNKNIDFGTRLSLDDILN